MKGFHLLYMATTIDTIFKALKDINRQRPENDQLELHPNTPIVGAKSRLDSLALVNFIVAVEQHVAADLGAEIVLSEDRTLGDEATVLADVSTLARHVDTLIQESRDHGSKA